MSKFRARHTVDAFQFTYAIAIGKTKMPKWAIQANKDGKLTIGYVEKIHNSHTGMLKKRFYTEGINPNDWIIKGGDGELYLHKPDLFEQLFEKI
jgi:hypothetical protein